MSDPGNDGQHEAQDLGATQLGRVSVEREEAILAALGDPSCRAILTLLNDRPRTVQDLLRELSVPQSSVYRKLGELQGAGLVGVQRSVLSTEGRRTDLFRSLLAEGTVHFGGGGVQVLAKFRVLASERMADLWEELRKGGER
ncbi:MAG: helix-turn-helix transcriptional regulator [Euryarchaeota archaeon]|nr:helix-turn-helix transcriptional regulator [Euryarchaeota archaeon]MDE1835625.1 helix-turn-helix transcriptional regulator [Euryarchaeota archaeon]MDE1878973.1 helix-turn-helix transcriptional regulator [Euryarchaeota archaeon]MDE2043753.1 helix-turn-helix transcriptional regulator [Thermoplasmata archaeon]